MDVGLHTGGFRLPGRSSGEGPRRRVQYPSAACIAVQRFVRAPPMADGGGFGLSFSFNRLVIRAARRSRCGSAGDRAAGRPF